MRLLSWNCRGLGGASTISQLKESQRLYLPDMTFVCETKQKVSFIKTVCRQLQCKNNWAVVDPIGKSGGLFLFWGDNITVLRLEKGDFSMEVEVEGNDFAGKWWIIFVYLSPDDHKRREQWEDLKRRRHVWGQRWLIGRDFNDILGPEDKKGGRIRSINSCWPF